MKQFSIQAHTIFTNKNMYNMYKKINKLNKNITNYLQT